jgi:hypothetical protein
MIVLTELQKNQFVSDHNGDEFGLCYISGKYFQPIQIIGNLYILPEDNLLDGCGIKRELSFDELTTIN